MTIDKWTRREFLKESGALLSGIATLTVLTTFFSENLAAASKTPPDQAQYIIPTYQETIAPALRQRNLKITTGHELAGGGAFKEFLLTRSGQTIGHLLTMEPKKGGFFDLMVTNGDHPENFSYRASEYEQLHNNHREVIVQVAGAFSCKGNQCRSSDRNEWEPDGFLIQKGKQMGWPTPNTKYVQPYSKLSLLLKMEYPNTFPTPTSSHAVYSSKDATLMQKNNCKKIGASYNWMIHR
ncbi:MAG: hypothetical protein UW70_C0044G0005 [Candidatus Peregrinibacteria bacterium GW2011_GWA2_44_7]|nr:MAG: hypothetical protein UW70_C0044G0005 [Candidatus Peregrinibacteria bacterium GW2011_GWA2_44_7]